MPHQAVAKYKQLLQLVQQLPALQDTHALDSSRRSIEGVCNSLENLPPLPKAAWKGLVKDKVCLCGM